MADLDDDWLLCEAGSVRSWATVLSQARVSTVDGLGLSEATDPNAIHTLEGVLQIVGKLRLKRYAFDQIEQLQEVAQGETFRVSKCRFDDKVIAVKHIRQEETTTGGGRHAFQKRLHSVLREISIMHHSPLAHHPNIIDLYGYGWRLQEQRPAPYIVLEFGDQGSLRNYLTNNSLDLRTKLIFAGDVACGLMALHQCGVVHGDVKLDNVIVFPSLDRPSGCIAKICDFGHSLLLESDSEKQLRYFGTTLYNAPEVAEQKNTPISREKLHKCDIWAYGLLVWEILAGGSVFFQKGWRRDPAFARSREDSLTKITTEDNNTTDASSVKAGEPSIDADETGVLGSFDIKHVRMLAKQHVSELQGGHEIGFAKGFLKPLFERTLQEDPSARISDLTRSPIVSMWNKSPGSTSIRSRLAIYAGTSSLTYDIFRRELERYFLWSHQVQLLQDFETLCAPQWLHEGSADAAFQTALCYLNGFGTSCDLTKATQYLRRAEEEGHTVAKLLNPQILGAIARLPSQTCSYEGAVKAEVRRDHAGDRSKQLHIFPSAVSKPLVFANYESFRKHVILSLGTHGIESWRFSAGASSHRLDLLEGSVSYDDLELAENILSNPRFLDPAYAGRKESVLLQAARYGNPAMIQLVVQELENQLSKQENHELAHLIFCFASDTHDLANKVLDFLSARQPIQDVLRTYAEVPTHPQWPVRLHGTPLAIAVAAGSLAGVQALLEAGADPLTAAFEPDSAVKIVWTPLHLAVRYHLPNIVLAVIKNLGSRAERALLDSNFPLGCAFSYSSPAQRYALHSVDYSERMIKTLSCLPPVALELMSPEGKTPLSQAIDFGDVDVVHLLLTRNPKLARKPISRPTEDRVYTYPLHYAAKIGSASNSEDALRVVQHVWKAAPYLINTADSSGATPMHMAASGVSMRTSEFLASYGANINACDRYGQTPLHLCCFRANAVYLLDNGADMNVLDSYGLSPAHIAARDAHTEPLAEYLQRGADPNCSDNAMGTLLHCAVNAKSRASVLMILGSTPNINALNRQGKTPLHLAIQGGQADLATILLEANADPFILPPSGTSPLVMALADGSSAIIRKILQFHNGRLRLTHYRQMLHFVATTGDVELLKEVLRHRHKMSNHSFDGLRNDQNRTPLHVAALSSHAEIVGILLEIQATSDAMEYVTSLCARDLEGNTPFLLACQSGPSISRFSSRASTCRILLQFGADLGDRNYAGSDAGSLAKNQNDLALMKFLLLEQTTRRRREHILWTHWRSLLPERFDSRSEGTITTGGENESDLSHEKPPGYHVVSIDDVQVVEETEDNLDTSSEAHRLNLNMTSNDVYTSTRRQADMNRHSLEPHYLESQVVGDHQSEGHLLHNTVSTYEQDLRMFSLNLDEDSDY